MDHPLRKSLTEIMVSGALDHHPKLKFVIVEFHAGWVPHCFWLSDFWNEHRAPTPKLDLKPSEYFQRNMWVTFINDPLSVPFVDLIGADRLMWSSDYPHVESSWPKSKTYVDELFAGQPNEVTLKVTRDNAAKIFGLQPS